MTRVKELTFSREIKQTCDAIKCYLLTALKYETLVTSKVVDRICFKTIQL
jgi:hypothetical protein